ADAGRFVPVPRLLLQPLPARRTDQEHPRLLLGQPGLPLRSRRLTLAVAVAAAVLTGCGSGTERACGGAAGRTGVGLTVEAPLADAVSKATMKTCWGDTCTTANLTLHADTKAEPIECTGTGQDAACGAS